MQMGVAIDQLLILIPLCCRVVVMNWEIVDRGEPRSFFWMLDRWARELIQHLQIIPSMFGLNLFRWRLINLADIYERILLNVLCHLWCFVKDWETLMSVHLTKLVPLTCFCAFCINVSSSWILFSVMVSTSDYFTQAYCIAYCMFLAIMVEQPLCLTLISVIRKYEVSCWVSFQKRILNLITSSF